MLLVQLRGRKRFRVAGATVGSPVLIDRWLASGDALYIPALYFHSGGDSGGPSAAGPALEVLGGAGSGWSLVFPALVLGPLDLLLERLRQDRSFAASSSASPAQ